MSEQTSRSTGTDTPSSHCRGKVPIVGTFATPGVVCTNSYLSPHGEGVGDHRFQVHDFDARLILGSNYLKSMRLTGRALRCGVERTVKKYNNVLQQMLIRHRAFEKIEDLQLNHSNLFAGEFQPMFNAWGKEVTQLMLRSKKRCNKFRDGNIEFSPVIGLWIHRLQAYRWISRYQSNQVAHSGNLVWLCRCLSIPSPSSLTVEEVITLEVVCITETSRSQTASTGPPEQSPEQMPHLSPCKGRYSSNQHNCRYPPDRVYLAEMAQAPQHHDPKPRRGRHSPQGSGCG